MAEADAALLQTISFFAGLAPADLQRVAAAAREQALDKEALLFAQDDPAERIYVLKEGRVKLFQLSEDGQQVLMRVVTPGMLFAAISLVRGTLYPVTAQAAEPLRLLVWPQEVMLGLLRDCPALALNALEVLAGHVREFQDRYRELATERVERRVARSVLRLARQTGRKTEEGILLDLPLTRQDLAEMSGTTLFTVSRILTQWEAQGLVAAGRERLVIRRAHGLVSIAEDLQQPRR